MNLSTIILFNNFLTIYFFIKSLCSIAKCHYSLEEAKIAKCKFLLLIFSFYIRYYEGFCGGGAEIHFTGAYYYIKRIRRLLAK